MEELIRKKCEEYDLTPDLLTPDELEDLRSEIEREQKGEQLLDSVLDNPEIHLRGVM
jgi:hypothetical protein